MKRAPVTNAKFAKLTHGEHVPNWIVKVIDLKGSAHCCGGQLVRASVS